jgi:hypothetical protein
MVTTVLVGIAGPGLLLKPGSGLYWMIPAVPASLADGMITRGHPEVIHGPTFSLRGWAAPPPCPVGGSRADDGGTWHSA